MTKMTVEQAVLAVQAARTEEAIAVVLEGCTKPQLHRVFLAVTGSDAEQAPKSWKKAELVKYYAARIRAYYALEEFKAMDAESKGEYIRSGEYEHDNARLEVLFHACSLYEVIKISAVMGASYEDFEDFSKEERPGSLMFQLFRVIKYQASWNRMYRNSKRSAEVQTGANLEEHAEVDEKLSEETPAEDKTELQVATSNHELSNSNVEGEQFEFTDELFEAYFPDGIENCPESEMVELYSYELAALNRYLARKGQEDWSQQELSRLRRRFEFAKKQLAITRGKYEAVKAVNTDGNKYLLMVAAELRRAYQKEIVSYRLARTELREYEAELSAERRRAA